MTSISPRHSRLKGQFSLFAEVYWKENTFQQQQPWSTLFVGLIGAGLGVLGILLWDVKVEEALFCFLQLCFLMIGWQYLKKMPQFSPSSPLSPPEATYLESQAQDAVFIRKLYDALFWGFVGLYMIVKLIPLAFVQKPPDVALSPTEGLQFAYALLVPFSEELFFRGFILSAFYFASARNNKQVWPTGEFLLINFLQSAVWALLHINYYQVLPELIPILLSGFLFGLLFCWKKNIWTVVGLHLVGNAVANVFSFFL